MKKNIITFIFIILGFIFTPSVFAETSVSIKPIYVNVLKGQKFKISVFLNPNKISNYTTKIELKYPASLLSVSSFRQDSSWMPLKQPGYDLIDNKKGILIKTGGFPGGFSSGVKFGTVLFTARKTGIGSIKIGGASISLDGNSKNVISSKPENVTVKIINSVPKKSIKYTKIPADFIFNKKISKNDSGKEVAYLELCLRDQKFYEGKIDGYFNAELKKSVIKFQEKYSDEILSPWGFKKGTGVVGNTTNKKLNEVCINTQKEKKQLLDVTPAPNQLFDINFEIDDTTVSDIKNLSTRVLFSSFGNVPTLVNLTFTIVDSKGGKVYSEKDTTVVETEKVITKRFKQLDLAPGKYSIVVDTLYNTNVKDEFTDNFEITKSSTSYIWVWATLVLLVILLFVFYRRRIKNKLY